MNEKKCIAGFDSKHLEIVRCQIDSLKEKDAQWQQRHISQPVVSEIGDMGLFSFLSVNEPTWIQRFIHLSSNLLMSTIGDRSLLVVYFWMRW